MQKLYTKLTLYLILGMDCIAVFPQRGPRWKAPSSKPRTATCMKHASGPSATARSVLFNGTAAPQELTAFSKTIESFAPAN